MIPGHNWFGDQFPTLGLTEEEFLTEYQGTLERLAETNTEHGYSAAVFTQTTDVEGEINGFITYDRREAKAAVESVRKLNDDFMFNIANFQNEN